MATPSTYSIHHRRTLSLPTATVADRVSYAHTRSGLSFTALAVPMQQNRETVSQSLSDPLRMRSDRFTAFCAATASDPSWILYGDDPPPVVPLQGSTIGQRIRSWRASLGLSTRAFASLCNLPQSGIVSSWENSRNVPLVASLISLADAAGINAASFLPLP